ncbi:hypothetical protein MRY87_10625 [bacterium]|nr:hypothetical protein [bacterium]
MRVVKGGVLIIYQGVLFVLLFPALFCLWLHPRGRRRLRERLGGWDLPEASYLWVHGASAGELKGLLPVIPALRERYPGSKILLTSLSVTGIERFGDHGDEARLLPFDLWPCLWRALPRDVELFVFGETELWPLLLGLLQGRGVPCVLLNGRIEPGSWRWYSKFSALFSPVVSNLKLAAVTSSQTEDHLLHLGLSRERTVVTGNMKYDTAPSYEPTSERKRMRERLIGELPERKIITLGSVHPGEERFWIEGLSEELHRGEVLLVIVPRHLEKLHYFSRALQEAELSCQMWSRFSEDEGCRVLLVDSFGELERFFAPADLVFIGGTLVSVGGHNPFEAAPYRVPIAVGSCVSQIRGEVRQLEAHGACVRVSSVEDIRQLVTEVLAGSEEVSSCAERLFQLWNAQRGTTEGVVERLAEISRVEER